MDTNLQIVVSAVNDAAGPLAQVASSFNDIENAAIAAAEGTLSQWNDAASSVEEATAGLSDNFANQMELMNSSAAEAADAAATDWQASVSELQTSLADASTKAADDFNGMAESAAASGEEMESSISSVGGKIQMVGVQLGILGAAIAGPAVLAVKAAGDQEDAFDQLQNAVKNVAIAQGLSAEATASLQEQFEQASRSNTALGLSITDSAQAFQFLFSTTGNAADTMLAYQDAINLAAAKGIDLKTATTDVVQTMNGQNRSLQVLGITTKDGLTGMDALAALNAKVAGSAQLAATQGLGPLSVATADFNKTMADFGVTVLPLLTKLLEVLTNIIAAVDAWSQAHPKLAESLLIFLGLVGGILVVLAPFLTFIGFLVIATEALNTVMAIFGATMAVGIGAVALYVAAFMAIIAVIALVIVYHTQIMNEIKVAWDWIVNEVSTATVAILGALQGWGASLTKWWNDLWNGVISVIQGAFNTVMSIVNNILSAISRVTGAVSGITGAVGGAVGGAFSGAIHAFATGGIVNGPTLALVGEAGPEAIIPLSAFAGGSGLSGGGFGSGGGIVVNVTGNNISSQLDLRNLAQSVGQELVRVLRQNQKLSI